VLMPVMDGWAVLNQLKADAELKHIPVIMLTIANDKSLGFALGAAEYLTKPIDRSQLVELLERLRCAGDQCQVLIVEDDDAIRGLTRRMLEDEGWIVTEAANGREALNALASVNPQLILLDLMMPEMDGFDFLAELRRSPDQERRQIQVVVVTAKDLTSDERNRLNGNVEKIIQKGGPDQDHAILMDELRTMVAASMRTRAVVRS
jgi:CheY-like chemotaxis protein